MASNEKYIPCDDILMVNIPLVDEHVSEETPGLVASLGVVDERTVERAAGIGSDRWWGIGQLHRIVDEHSNLADVRIICKG